MEIPDSLITKYNLPVPRYTSYPPANCFHSDLTADDYKEAIKNSNREWPENISFYIHIPFCTKLCYFCGCNSHLTRDKNKIQNYTDAVRKEILMVKKLLDPSRKVSQVHWGGGTPNSLPAGIISEIMELINNNFSFITRPEIAIECHPALLNKLYIKKLINAGFNRFSLGIQDFREDVLANVNRDAPEIPIDEIVSEIKSYEGTGINLDFIYGLPFQTIKTFSETIEKAVQLSPDRLVTFSYAHVPWIKKAQKILESKGLPEAKEKLGMFKAGYEILTANGYTPIGLDHYAKNDDELSIALKNRKLHRNFQGYCTRETTGQVYAFGATGISQLESIYAQNDKDPLKYSETINNGIFTTAKGYKVSRDEKIIRHVITEIMCNEYLSLQETGDIFKMPVEKIHRIIGYRKKEFEEFVKDGLLITDSDEIFRVTEKGRFFIRVIASKFDTQLKSETGRFSRSL
jgi:oxygen-independent coproporphyrinogen-3 oxidase